MLNNNSNKLVKHIKFYQTHKKDVIMIYMVIMKWIVNFKVMILINFKDLKIFSICYFKVMEFIVKIYLVMVINKNKIYNKLLLLDLMVHNMFNFNLVEIHLNN